MHERKMPPADELDHAPKGVVGSFDLGVKSLVVLGLRALLLPMLCYALVLR